MFCNDNKSILESLPKIDAEWHEEIVLSKVIGAFQRPGDYRTVGGIARTADLTRETVRLVIHSHPELFDMASVRIGGQPVYALKESEPVVPV